MNQDTPITRGSQLLWIEESDDRLVFEISAAGSGQGYGVLGLQLCTPLFFTAIRLLANLVRPGITAGDVGVDLLTTLPIWAAGLGLCAVALLRRFARTIVNLDRQNIVVESVAGGWTRRQHLALLRERPAELVLLLGSRDRAFQDPNETFLFQKRSIQVHEIQLRGTTGTVRFGSALLELEQDRLLDRINEFLGHGRAGDVPILRRCPCCDGNLSGGQQKAGGICPHCVVPVSGTTATSADSVPLAPLPEKSAIRITANSSDHLRFSFPLIGDPLKRWFWPGLLLTYVVFGGAVTSILSLRRGPVEVTPQNDGWLLVGLGVIGFIVSLYRSVLRYEIDLTRERLTCQAWFGPFGWAESLPTREIERVGREFYDGQPWSSKIRRSPDGRAAVDRLKCVARAGRTTVRLTRSLDPVIDVQVVELITHRLSGWGMVVAGES